ncbi:MAG: hypothetical protein ACE5FS_14145 [Paracoccaceae bacterium]
MAGFRLLLLIAVLFVAHRLALRLVRLLDPEALVGHQELMVSLVAAALLLYAVLIAIPFVPGVEIGIGLLVVLGAPMAPFVYVATLAGLSIAYLLGRLVPARILERVFRFFLLKEAAALSSKLAPLDGPERLRFLLERAPARWVPFLLKNRHIALAVAVNIPGSSLIGGGGGICLLAGISGLFGFRAFLLTLAIAVAPVPIVVFFVGPDFLWL